MVTFWTHSFVHKPFSNISSRMAAEAAAVERQQLSSYSLWVAMEPIYQLNWKFEKIFGAHRKMQIQVKSWRYEDMVGASVLFHQRTRWNWTLTPKDVKDLQRTQHGFRWNPVIGMCDGVSRHDRWKCDRCQCVVSPTQVVYTIADTKRSKRS